MKHRSKRQPQVQFITNVAAPAKRLSKRAKMKLAKHGKGFSTQRADPSRTGPMVRAMIAKLQDQFALLKERIVKQVGEQDMLGLAVVGTLAEPDVELVQERKLIAIAKAAMQRKESPDYGQLFFKSETQEVWYVSADGDDNMGWLEEQLKEVPLIRKVTVEAETFPKRDGTWMQLFPKIKRYGEYTANCQPGQLRGADGRCGPGIGLGISRDDMPQIPADKILQFIQWCRQQGVGVSEEQASVHEMQPVQTDFRQERVDAIPDEAMTQPVVVCRSKTLNANPNHDERGRFAGGEFVSDGKTYWHGTNREGEDIDPNKSGGVASFTEDKYHSRQFGNTVHKVLLDVRNPIDLRHLGSGADPNDNPDEATSSKDIEKALKDHGIHVDLSRGGKERKGFTTALMKKATEEIKRQAIEKGYDGVKVMDYKENEAEETQVFHPHQIKVIGRDEDD